MGYCLREIFEADLVTKTVSKKEVRRCGSEKELIIVKLRVLSQIFGDLVKLIMVSQGSDDGQVLFR